jgi:hypothetical protein
VTALFEELRVPTPPVSARLGTLRDEGLVVARGGGANRWSLTPRGEGRVVDLIGEIVPAQLEAQLAETVGAEFGHAYHTLVPPSMAPAKWSPGIAQLLSRFPFETNVLCMTRFPDPEKHPDDPIQNVIDTVRDALDAHGLVLHLASDQTADEDLFGNVAAYMWACQYGIGLAEDRVGESLNYNLVAEVAGMLLAGRRCAMLRDRTAPDMPTDIIGRIYKPCDFDDLDAVSGMVHLWAAKDLDLGRCRSCPAA